MRLLLITARHTWGWTLRLGLLLLVAAALLVAAGRLALPMVSDYRAELERGLEEYLGLPVRLQGAAAAWSGGGPVLRLDGLSLHDPDGGAPLLSATRAVVGVDLPRSLWWGRWVLGNVHLTGPRLVLVGEAGGPRLLGGEGGGGPHLRELPELLAGVRALDIDSGELVLRIADRPPLILRELRISLRGGDALRLGLAAGLAQEGRLEGAVELRRRAGATAWDGRFYLRGRGLGAELWGPAAGDRPVDGRLGLDVWGDMRDGLPVGAVGRLTLDGTAAAPGILDGTFRWRRAGGGWTWVSDWQAGAGRAPLSSLDLAMTGAGLEGRATGLDLAALAAAAAVLDPGRRSLLDALAPRGAAPELEFRVDLERPAAGFAVAARIAGLALSPQGRRPGLAGLDGRFYLDPSGGRAVLDSRDLRLEAPGLFRAPLRLATLTGELAWRRGPQGVVVDTPGLRVANPDLWAELRGGIHLGPEGGPRLDLAVDFRNLSVARAGAYLPTGIMPPPVVAWLDRALAGGRVPGGRLVFRGRTAEFPFRQGGGLFETRFQVRGATLDYLPGWPAVRDLDAWIEFRNQGFSARAESARIFDAALSGVEVAIADLEHAELTLTGRAAGPGDTLLRYVRESPLAAQLGGAVGQLRVQGDNTLDLELAVPLGQRSRTAEARVRGRVGFAGGTVRLPDWRLTLERLRGELAFDRRGLTAQGLRLWFRGAPARLDIDTREGLSGIETRYLLRTRQAAAALLGEWAGGLALPLSGETDWDLALVLPGAERAGDFALVLVSQLQGLEVALPPPLHKPAAEAREFTLRLQGGRGAPLWVGLDYGLAAQGPTVRAELELEGFPDRPRFNRGELRINAGQARLPQALGLAVVARLPQLALDALEVGAGPGGWPDWLAALDLRCDRLQVRGWRLDGVQALGENRDGVLRLRLTGDGARGRLLLPARPTPQAPVDIKLERLALTRAAGPAPRSRSRFAPPDPRGLPPLRLAVEDLVVDGRSLGRLRLALESQADGVSLSRLELASELHSLTGNGRWLATGDGSESRIEASLRSRDLGASLAALGYPVGLHRGRTEARLALAWNGPWSDPRLDTLAGQVELTMGEGRLEDIEPGMGRVVGLFSIPGLLRRLRLDFSDLFREGLAFDGIAGRFELAGGAAVTENLTLESPAARIRIQGRIGLAARDYDQIVTVAPRVSTALPVAGAIAGGPAVGAALFIAERLLQEDIDQAARVRYRVTGPWDAPLVERLGGPSPAAIPAEPGRR